MAFNVVVKSDSKGGAKGQFQCEVTKAGLELTQKKKTITIPIGSDARYTAKNQFEVQLPDSRLDITVTKFGSYQHRMAKDLVEYISHKGPAPDVSSYTLPWYFYGLSVLPIGIPIITRGGAIPALIGFGLMGGCFAIAQNEEMSTATRLLLMGLIVVAAYGAIGGLIVMSLSAR